MYSTVEFLSPVLNNTPSGPTRIHRLYVELHSGLLTRLHQDLPGSIRIYLLTSEICLKGLCVFMLCVWPMGYCMCVCQSVLSCVCHVLRCDCLLKEPFDWNNMSVLNPVPASTVNLPQFVWSCKTLDSRTSCLTCVTQGTLRPKWVNVCVCVCVCCSICCHDWCGEFMCVMFVTGIHIRYFHSS